MREVVRNGFFIFYMVLFVLLLLSRCQVHMSKLRVQRNTGNPAPALLPPGSQCNQSWLVTFQKVCQACVYVLL